MHHLINELRPHQARESIRVSLQVQKKQRIETAARLNKQVERVQELIKNAITSINDYNISTILQESKPEIYENFNKQNAHSQSINGSSDVNEIVFNTDETSLPKMSELDAFMCDFVDEIF